MPRFKIIYLGRPLNHSRLSQVRLQKNDNVSNGFHLCNEQVSAGIYILYVHNNESTYCIVLLLYVKSIVTHI